MRITDFGHMIPPLNAEGPYKGYPGYTDIAVSAGMSPGEVRDREIRKLMVLRAATERRLKQLRALPDHPFAS
ncbi:hypothetical protein [Methylorubrum extorquens]|uniref:hypothetical protein n=1 Tax=Methylorubrum extorquens TaxID=408 RepID=UPI0022380F8D|nr:hypothetical protein [Methylorubrum extorquens]UYW32524.1 hypothetical protein OKB92_26770 [Methylorubrum extorquens]